VLSSFIPISSEAPIYPQSHIDVMLARVATHFPEMSSDAATMFLCDLFNVTGFPELLDVDGYQDRYELQPAVSSSELDDLTRRVLPYFDPALSAFDQKRVVRGVINCVPKTLDDLVDYLHPEDVSKINGVFSTAIKLPGSMEKEFAYRIEQPLPELMADPNHDAVQVAGSVVMTMQNEKGCPVDDAMPERQNILRRAAEFYLLHLYHCPVASLWLAKYLNPLTFCHCSNTECEGRAFGFADAHAMVKLVLQNLGYIEDLFQRDEKDVVTEKSISLGGLKTEYLALIMDAVEVLLTIDQEREQPQDVKRLLEFVANRKDLTPPVEYCRAIALTTVAWDLYDDKATVQDLFFIEVEGDKENLKYLSVLAFDQYSATVSERPLDKHMPLFDAHNFFAHGNNWVSPGYGMKLRSYFLLSLFDGEYMDIFLKETGGIPDDPDAPEGLREIVVGYKKNLLGVVARRGFSLPENLCCAAFFATSDEVVKDLADLAWPTGIRRYLESHESEMSESQAEFWKNRLSMAKVCIDIHMDI